MSISLQILFIFSLIPIPILSTVSCEYIVAKVFIPGSSEHIFLLFKILLFGIAKSL
jgi:hypothetical protein